MAEQKLPKPIEIGGFQLGWITDYANQNTPLDGADGQYRYSYGCSVIRPGKKDSISPAEIFNNVLVNQTISSVNSLPRAVAVQPDTTTHVEYFVLGGLSGTAPAFLSVNTSLATISRHDITAPNGNFTTLPGTGFWGEDVCFYPSPNGAVTTPASYFYYTYNTSTKGYLGQFYPGGPTYTDDFITTGSVTLATGSSSTLVAGVPHRMTVGTDRILYITNGQYIASYDGTSDQTAATGTFNSYALDLGPGWIAVDVVPQTGYSIAIACVRMGTNYQAPNSENEARIIYWDGFSLDFNQVYPLNDWFVGSIKNVEGTLFAFTQGSNGTTKAKYLNPYAGKFQTAWEAPTSWVGNAPLPNQVEYFNGVIHWAGDTVTNMVFGLAPTPMGGWALHTPYYLSSGTSTVSKTGLLRNVNSNILYAGCQGTGDVSGYGIMGAYGDGISNGNVITSIANGTIQLRTKTYYTGYRATITKIKAYFWQFDGNTSCNIAMLPQKILYSGSVGSLVGDVLNWNISQTTHPNIATTLTASTSELGRSIIAPDISNFWIIFTNTNTAITATAPILDRLEIFYELPEKP